MVCGRLLLLRPVLALQSTGQTTGQSTFPFEKESRRKQGKLGACGPQLEPTLCYLPASTPPHHRPREDDFQE